MNSFIIVWRNCSGSLRSKGLYWCSGNRARDFSRVSGACQLQWYRIRYHGILAGAEKTLQKMRQNAAGCRIQDPIGAAENNGIDWRRPGRGGSHVIFSAKGVREIVSVPDKRPIKAVYVRQFVALVDAASAFRSGNNHERENHKAKH